MRRHAFALCLLLPACAGFGDTSVADAEPSIPAPRNSGPDEPTLRLTQGGRRVLAALVQQNGEMRIWRSPDGMVVATDGARVVATAGTAIWLAASRIDGEDPLDDPAAIIGRSVSMRRSVDLMTRSRSPDGMRFGLSLDCRLRAAPRRESILVEEGCSGGGFGFVNRYWADPANGAVWKSEQWVGEKGQPLLVEVVTPPPS